MSVGIQYMYVTLCNIRYIYNSIILYPIELQCYNYALINPFLIKGYHYGHAYITKLYRHYRHVLPVCTMLTDLIPRENFSGFVLPGVFPHGQPGHTLWLFQESVAK